VNSHFTELIGGLNLKRITRLMVSNPKYSQFKFLILAALNECIGPGKRYKYENNEELSSEKYRAQDFGSSFDIPDAPPFLLSNEPAKSIDYELRYIFNHLGVTIDDWFMNFSIDKNNRLTMANTPGPILTALLIDNDTQDLFNNKFPHDPSAPFQYYGPRAEPKNWLTVCDELRKRSKVALNEATKEADLCISDPTSSIEPKKPSPEDINKVYEHLLPTSQVLPPKVVQKCNGCHSGEKPVGGYIPFDNSVALGKLLNKRDKTLKERILYRISQEARNEGKGMPPDKSLDHDELENITRYLNSLQ
jgi:hypothetical protein